MPSATLPLDAMRRHQSIEKDVTNREVERYGRTDVEEEQRRRQSDIDRLYDEIMRHIAPSSRD